MRALLLHRGNLEAEAAVTDAQALSRGIYSVPDVARLTELDTKRVRRWVAGYVFKGRRGEERRSDPVFQRERAENGGLLMTFLDLVEVLFVKAFVEHGVSMPTIRRVQEEASREFDVRHPFCVRRFETDGETIIERFMHEGRERLLDRKRLQMVDVTIFNPLIKTLDYERVSLEARRWWPLGKSVPVVLDPAHAFGAAVGAESNVPTATLYAAARANKDVGKVADWYGTNVAEVRAAVAFEEGRRGRKKAA
jgi:hypothetical protein